MTQVPFENLSGKRVLLIQTAYPGDVLFGLPLAVALKTKFPGIRLIGLTSREAEGAWKGQPCFDQVVIWDKRGVESGPFHLLRIGRLLKKFDFDVVLAAHASFASALLSWLSSAPVRVGFRVGPGARFFTHPLNLPRETFEHRYGDFFELFALVPPVPGKVFFVDEIVKSNVRRSLAERHWFDATRRIAIAFGSKIPTKKWPAEKWGELLKRLTAQGSTRAVLLGTSSESAEAERIRSVAPDHVANLTGLSVAESAAVLQFSTLAIGVDSFGLHLARFLEVPCVGIFGPTDPRALDWRPNQKPVFLKGLSCRPCTVFHAPRRCPKGHHDCMNRLDESVLEESMRPLLVHPAASR